MSTRRKLVALVLVLAGLLLGCGSDEGTTPGGGGNQPSQSSQAPSSTGSGGYGY